MNHYLKKLGIFIGLILFYFLAPNVYADVAYPRDLCKWNEMIENCSIEAPEGKCLEYKRVIRDYGTHAIISPGEGEYCKKISSVSDVSKIVIRSRIIPALILTLVIEMPTFFLMGFRRRKEQLLVALANCISLPIFFFVLGLFPGKFWITLPILVLGEVGVIIFEFFFLAHFVKFQTKLKILITVLTANLISSILGTYLLILLIERFQI